MKHRKHSLFLAAADITALLLGFGLAFWFIFRSGYYGVPLTIPGYLNPSLAVAVLTFLFVYRLLGLYQYETILSPIHQIQKLVSCFFRVFAAFAMLAFFVRAPYLVDSRATIALGFLFAFLFTVLARVYALPRALRYLGSRRLIQKNTLVVGAGAHGRYVAGCLSADPFHYFNIVGFLDDDPALANLQLDGIPVRGASHDVAQVASQLGCEKAVIAINRILRPQLLDLVDRCREAGLAVHLVSDHSADVGEKLECEQFNGLTAFRLGVGGQNQVLYGLKRVCDFLGAGLLLLGLSPLFALIAWAIKRDSKGPVFYRCHEVGLNEGTFRAYKFRTMISESDPSPEARRRYAEGKRRHLDFMRDFIQGRQEQEFFVSNEDRITRVGRILRKYSLDELPQLINVLRGEMSLVGPRFCAVDELPFYLPWQKKRFQVKPGMTGLWQVRARSEVSYADMVMIDLYYIHNWSLLFDLEILVRTIPVVLGGKGSRVSARTPQRSPPATQPGTLAKTGPQGDPARAPSGAIAVGPAPGANTLSTAPVGPVSRSAAPAAVSS